MTFSYQLIRRALMEVSPTHLTVSSFLAAGNCHPCAHGTYRQFLRSVAAPPLPSSSTTGSRELTLSLMDLKEVNHECMIHSCRYLFRAHSVVDEKTGSKQFANEFDHVNYDVNITTKEFFSDSVKSQFPLLLTGLIYFNVPSTVGQQRDAGKCSSV